MAAPTVELREVHPFSQVLSKHATQQTSESNYSPIKDKDVTWEGTATQRLTIREAKEGEAPFALKEGCITFESEYVMMKSDTCFYKVLD